MTQARTIAAKNIAKRLLPSWVQRRIRARQHQRERDAFPVRNVRHVYGGFPLDVVLADRTAQQWYDRDRPWIPGVAELARHQLREGVTVFDIGAHQAVFALVMAKIVGSAGKVIAVEANGHSARIAEQNRQLNDCPQLTVLHAAGAEVSGRVRFGLNDKVDESGDPSYPTEEIPAWSVDDLAKQHGRPDVLYVDVEGYEAHVLRGARETLATRPDCMIEVHVGAGLERFGSSVAEIAAFFPPADYDLLMTSDNGPFEGVPFDADSTVASKLFYLIAIARTSPRKPR